MVEAAYPGEVLKTNMDACLGSIGMAIRYSFFFLHDDVPPGKIGTLKHEGLRI